MSSAEKSSGIQLIRIQEHIYTPGPSTLSSDYCGGTPLSLLLDGAGAILSLFGVVVSPLNTPTILPKNVFFFRASSSDWTPATACESPFLAGRACAFTEFPPNTPATMRSTQPLASKV